MDEAQRTACYEQAIQDAETHIKMLEGALRWIRSEAEGGTDRHEACDSIYGACDAALGDSEEVYSFMEIPKDECSICLRPIPPTTGVPLCARCLGTAKAHAKLEQASRDYAQDCADDPTLDRRVR